MAGNAAEHIDEPSLRIDVVQARGLDQGVEDGGALTAFREAIGLPPLVAATLGALLTTWVT